MVTLDHQLKLLCFLGVRRGGVDAIHSLNNHLLSTFCVPDTVESTSPEQLRAWWGSWTDGQAIPGQWDKSRAGVSPRGTDWKHREALTHLGKGGEGF